jgi:hypothetical protein
MEKSKLNETEKGETSEEESQEHALPSWGLFTKNSSRHAK